jgi:hypothetical protein
MMRNFGKISLLVVLIWLFFHTNISAQIHISGIIKDTTGKVLYARVSVIELSSEAGLAFTETDTNGFYSFILPDSLNPSFLGVRAVAPGYDKRIQMLRGRNERLDFILLPKAAKLPDVTVIQSPLLKKKGDTLSYLVSGFSNRNDKSINDVLKRIPGIDIDEDNIIRYQGQPINHLYIDGDDLLDNKYQFATKAIRPDIVDRAEVIQNNQHIKMLNGVVPATSPALNLTIKDKNRFSVSNSMELGWGTEGSTNDRFSSIAFKPKLKFINTGSYNNTGEALGVSVGSFSGAALPVSDQENSGADALIMPPSGIIPSLPRQRYINNHSGLGNINYFVKNDKGLEYKINGALINEKQEQFSDVLTQYYLPSDTIYNIQVQKIHSNRTLFSIHLTNTVNNQKKYINHTLSAYRNIADDASGIYNGFIDLNQQINSRAFRLRDQFNTIVVLRSRKLLELSSVFSYENKPQSMMLFPGVQADMLNQSKPYISTNQEMNIPVFFGKMSAVYRIPHSIFSQAYTIELITQQASLTSLIRMEQQDHTLKTADSGFSNSLRWDKNLFQLKGAYVFTINNIRITADFPISVPVIQSHNAVLNSRTRFQKPLFTPTLNLLFKFGNEHLLQARYAVNSFVTGMNEIYEGAVFRNYQTLVSSSVGIQNTVSRNLFIGLDFKNSLKLFSARIDGYYTEQQKAFIRSSVFSNNNFQWVSLPINNNSYSSGLTLTSNRYLYKLKTNISVQYGYDTYRSLHLQNHLLFPVTTDAQRISINGQYKPLDFFSIHTSFRSTWSTNISHAYGFKSTSPGKIRQQSSSITFDFSPFRGMSIKSVTEYLGFFEKSEKKSAAWFTDLQMQYKFIKSNSLLELRFSNITNQSDFRTLYTAENTFSIITQQLRPRILLISFFCDL